MNEATIQASDIQLGDYLYDNCHKDWFKRWPKIIKIESIAAGRLALTTTGRLFIAYPTERLLAKRGQA